MQARNTGDATARIRLNIGLTAHRDVIDSEVPRLRREVRSFFQRLQAEFPDLPLRLISALAEGGDQLVAEEALALGIELMVPLPMPQADYERDFDRAGARERFHALMARAQVRTLPLAPGNTSESLHQRGPARNRQYAQLGMFVSSHCQVLLALWDGKPSDATGGTAQVVDYHLRNAMPGFRAGDVAPNLLADDESDLVYHLHCPRRLPHPDAGEREADGLAGVPRWLTVEASVAGEAPMPAQYRHVFAQMQAFNHDAARHAAAIARDARSLLAADTPAPAPPAVREVDALFGAADWLAVHFRQRVRRGMLLTHGLAAAMGLAFILYLDYRGLAEGLRVQVYWRLAGVETPPNSSLGYDSFLQKQDVDLSWIRHAMRSTGLLRSEDFRTDADWLRWVIARWVGRRASATAVASGQLAYFSEGSRRREDAYRTTAVLGGVALAGGVLGALALLVAGGRLDPGLHGKLLLAMGLLPLLAGIREAFSYKNADKELIKQFRFMSRLFDSCRARLDRAADDAESRQLLRALGCACLEEHAEWILLHRERPLDVGGMSA